MAESTDTTSMPAVTADAPAAPPAPATKPAREPRANPGSRWLGILIGLVLIAVGVLAGRELWVLNADTTWQSWLNPAFDFFRGLEFQPWMGWTGVALLVVGLLFLIAALKPRPHTHRELPSEVSVWVRPVDVARYITAHSRRMSGVKAARTSLKRRTATLTATTVAPEAEVQPELERSVTERVQAAFGDTITVKVRTERATESRSSEVDA